MEDFDELVREAAKRGMYLMMDMVLNHTSTKHEWFQKALKGDPKYRNYYIFKKGKNGLPPTNWVSKFGGNAWSYLPVTNTVLPSSVPCNPGRPELGKPGGASGYL